MILLTFAGLAISLYLTRAHFTASTGECLGGSGCDAVLSSTWGTILGLPTALYGAFFYFSMALGIGRLGIVPESHRLRLVDALLALAVVAFGFSAFLTGYAIVKLDQPCPLCLASFGIVGMLAAGLWRHRAGSPIHLWKAAAIVLGTTFVFQMGMRYEASRVDVVADSSGSKQLAATNFGASITGTRHGLGNPEAPLVITEFSDFQCGISG